MNNLSRGFDALNKKIEKIMLIILDVNKGGLKINRKH